MATTTYGLTDTGYLIPPLQTIRDGINAALRAAFGASLDLGDRTIEGQLVGILAERLALVWEASESVNSSQDPDKATGAALDALCALTGTTRPLATFSTVVATLFGVPGTVVPSGEIVATASTAAQFTTSASATIATVPNWAGTTSYVVGARVFHDTNHIYQCIAQGTSAGSGGPTGTSSSIVDGTVTWRYIGTEAAAGAVDVSAVAVNTGTIVAAAGDLTQIATGVFGWNTVTNLADAVPGRDLATDDELRLLRQEELSGDGKSTMGAILAVLLKIVGITSATVFTNPTDATDSNGMPPHSIEAMVRTTWSPGDPSDQIIYDAVWNNVAAGIATVSTNGGPAGTSTDSQGVGHTVYFSRPTEIPIYIILNVTVDPKNFPADGITQIQTAVTTWGGAQSAGKDAVASGISAQAFTVTGMLDVTSCLIGTAPSPASSATIAISTRQLATYNSANIVVNVTNGTP